MDSFENLTSELPRPSIGKPHRSTRFYSLFLSSLRWAGGNRSTYIIDLLSRKRMFFGRTNLHIHAINFIYPDGRNDFLSSDRRTIPLILEISMLEEWRVCYALRNGFYFIFHSEIIMLRSFDLGGLSHTRALLAIVPRVENAFSSMTRWPLQAPTCTLRTIRVP